MLLRAILSLLIVTGATGSRMRLVFDLVVETGLIYPDDCHYIFSFSGKNIVSKIANAFEYNFLHNAGEISDLLGIDRGDTERGFLILRVKTRAFARRLIEACRSLEPGYAIPLSTISSNPIAVPEILDAWSVWFYTVELWPASDTIDNHCKAVLGYGDPETLVLGLADVLREAKFGGTGENKTDRLLALYAEDQLVDAAGMVFKYCE